MTLTIINAGLFVLMLFGIKRANKKLIQKNELLEKEAKEQRIYIGGLILENRNLKTKLRYHETRESTRQSNQKLGDSLLGFAVEIAKDFGIEFFEEQKPLSLEEQLQKAIEDENFELAEQLKHHIEELKNQKP